MEKVPIDIASGKLVDWLVSRRHCDKDWGRAAAEVRQLLAAALEDMPEHPEIRRLLADSLLHYFVCQRIVAVLQDTEKDSKNFLGFYSSQRMKDWQEVLKAYERNNLYLAEGAQILQRLVQYEAPGLRRQIQKALQTAAESEKKAQDQEKAGREAQRDWDKHAAKLHISALPSANLRRELLSLADKVPDTLARLAKDSAKLRPARQLYAAFRGHLLAGKGMAETQPLLPALAHLAEKGNTSTYEWLHGQPPKTIKPLQLLADEEEEETADDAIDFGDDAAIDFGGAEEVEIDLGEISVEAEEGVATGTEAMSLLENPKTRALVLRDLAELGAFLGQRLAETRAEWAAEAVLKSQSDAHAFPAAALAGEEALAGMAALAEGLVAELSEAQTRHLLAVRASPAYLSRLVEELATRRRLPDRHAAHSKASLQRAALSRDAAKDATARLASLVRSAKDLHKDLQHHISQRYDGRPVNIMAGTGAFAV